MKKIISISVLAVMLLSLWNSCASKDNVITVPDNYNDALAMAKSMKIPLFVDFFSPT